MALQQRQLIPHPPAWDSFAVPLPLFQYRCDQWRAHPVQRSSGAGEQGSADQGIRGVRVVECERWSYLACSSRDHSTNRSNPHGEGRIITLASR